MLRVCCIEERLLTRLAEWREGIYTPRRARNGFPAPNLPLVPVSYAASSGTRRRHRRCGEASDVAIIMLTAKGETDERIIGLDAGADDYVPKPFRFQELLARIRAVLRRRDIVLHRVLKAADVTLDRGTREVTRAEQPVDLTPREFDLLELLLAHPGQVFPRETILNRLWGYTFVGDSNVIDVHIGALREKMGDRPPKLIQAVRGVGYVLRA